MTGGGLSRYTVVMTQDPSTAAERANTFPWPPVLVLIAVALAVLLGRVAPLPWPGIDDTPAHVVGLGIGLLGFVIMLAGVFALLRHDTTVRPDKASSTLVTAWPFSFFRNPIYLGEVMIMLGLAEVTKNIWFVAAALAFAALVTWLQIIPEERHLEARFGDDYLAYKQRARRWI